MDGKFYSGIFEGDSPGGVKLGMSLTGGDFWPRVDGCQNLYRSEGDGAVDFTRIVASVDVGEDSVSVPVVFDHDAMGVYVYVLRRVNCCGNEEQSERAVVRVGFDSAGELIGSACNVVFGLYAEWATNVRIRLGWLYTPLNQLTACNEFHVYTNGGDGAIDFESAIAVIEYASAGFYSYEIDASEGMLWRVCVSTISDVGVERFCGEISTQISLNEIAGIGQIDVEVI